MKEELTKAYQVIRQYYADNGLSPERVGSLIRTPKWTFCFGEQQAGMAFHFGVDHAVYGKYDSFSILKKYHALVGSSLFSLVEALLAQGSTIAENALCLSTLNALSRPLTQRFLQENPDCCKAAQDVSWVGSDDNVLFIGYGAFITQVAARAKSVSICDMRPVDDLQTLVLSAEGEERLLQRDAVFAGGDAAPYLRKADVLFLTGSTLVNESWRSLIRQTSPHCKIAMYGPSGALPPAYLFSCGVDYLYTSVIREPTDLQKALAQNGTAAAIDEHLEKLCLAKNHIANTKGREK